MANYKDIKYDFSGENLTALNATQLTSGTTPDARYTTLPAVSGANLTSLTATNLSSGTVPTARLGTGTASSSTVLYGDNTWAAAGGANTPAFFAYRTAAQTIAGAAEVIIGYDTELFDSDGAYDTSAFTFTPQTAGKYFISGSLNWNEYSSDYLSMLKMWKNGTGGTKYGRFGFTNGSTGGGDYFGARCTAIVDLNGSSDYVQMSVYQYSGLDKDSMYGLDWIHFMGYKLIGA
jgi:hypothetical protein